MAKKGRKTADNEQLLMKTRREVSIKNMYFNRFMLVRYSLAIFFFANFLLAYAGWGTIAGICGTFLFLMTILPCWEMGTMYGKRKAKYRFTLLFFVLQWMYNAATLVMVWTLPMSSVWPFLTDSSDSRTFVTVLVVIGLFFATWVLWRFRQIAHNADKTWKRIQFFEAKYNMHI